MTYKLVAVEEINVVSAEDIGFYKLQIKGKKDDKFKDIVISRKEFVIIDGIIEGIIPMVQVTNYVSFNEVNTFFSTQKTLLDDHPDRYVRASGRLEYDLNLMGSVYTNAWNTTIMEIIKVLEYAEKKYDSKVLLVFVEQF